MAIVSITKGDGKGAFLGIGLKALETRLQPNISRLAEDLES